MCKAVALTVVGYLLAAAVAPGIAYFPPALTEAVPECRDPNGIRTIVAMSPFVVSWYSSQLRAACEPSLSGPASNGSPAGGRIRFTWLRSFHRPIIVRLEGVGTDKPQLIAKELSGAGGYAPGAGARSVDRQLERSDVDRIAGMVRSLSVIVAPKPKVLKRCGIQLVMPPGLDGARWIIEGAGTDGYRFADSWSPKAGTVHDIGMEMLKLTEWNVEPIY